MSWFGLQALDNFRDLVAKATGSSGEGAFSKINSSFYHGKFKKYSAELGERSYILKVKMNDYPELPATEYLCNQIARAMQIVIPEFFLIEFGESPAFATKNFVEKKTSRANLVHIYRYFSKKDEFDCETLCRVISRETGRLQEEERFLELCLFDALIGNHDRHGRNIAILEFPGKKILAPFYDNPSYIGLEEESLLGADLSPRGKIATQSTDQPTMKDYVAEIKRLKREGVIEKFSKKLDFSKLSALVNESILGEKRKQAMIRLMEKRCRELREVLSHESQY